MPGEWVGGLVERCWVDGLVEVGELRRDEKSSLRADVLKLLSCVEDASGRGEDQQPWLRFAGSSGELTRPAASRLRVAHPAVLFLSATPLESDYKQLWNQLDVFGLGASAPTLCSSSASDDEKRGWAGTESDVRLRALSGGGGGGDHQGCRDQRRRRQGRSAPRRTRRRTILRIATLDTMAASPTEMPTKGRHTPRCWSRHRLCCTAKSARSTASMATARARGPPRRGTVLSRPHPR